MEKCSWRGNFCIEVNPLPNVIVIMGAMGDLSSRKLLPALFNLDRRGLLNENSKIIACARRDGDDITFRNFLRENLAVNDGAFEKFADRFGYVSGDFGSDEFYGKLKNRLETLSGMNFIFYMATASDEYVRNVGMLHKNGLTVESPGVHRHVVFEKPFGTDLHSALELNEALSQYLIESQIYRIDHYLGKETVQNILMFRFANIIFEPVWNRNYIESVTISAFETLGVGHRAKYFDKTGILRDMFQNHMLEMLSLVAMECPHTFEADAVRSEKLKLLESIRMFRKGSLEKSFKRGQYETYREEENVSPDSQTETFVSGTFMIDNWRWKDVPFYLAAGKKLACKKTEIFIQFKPIPHSIFSPVRACQITPNSLTLTVQPQEGLTLSIQAKHPGPKLCMGPLDMDFKYSSLLEEGESMPDAYERLLLDCMNGDQTLFIRSDTIRRAWEILTPVLESWDKECPLFTYPQDASPDLGNL